MNGNGKSPVNLTMLSEPPEKKIAKVPPPRVDERVAAAIDELMAAHAIRNRSEYLRGLVYLDGLLSGAMPEDADVPHWVRRAYPQLFHRKAA
jgi:hypothetical protein